MNAMKLPHRRRFLHLAAGAAALPVLSSIARAQTYPARPVRWIVAWARFTRSRQFAELTVLPLSKLRERIQKELRLQLGGPGEISGYGRIRSQLRLGAVGRQNQDGYC
jgi:hypothetical protein